MSAPIHAATPLPTLSGVWCTGGVTAAFNRGRLRNPSRHVTPICLTCRERTARDATAVVLTAAAHGRITEAAMEKNVIAWLRRKGLR